MSFAARLTRCPIPHDAEAAARLPAMAGDLPAGLRALLQGAAGCSTYLAGLIADEADWLAEALAAGPESALAAILAADPPPASETAARHLRRGKGRIALLTGLADLGGVWSLEEVTGALTRFADLAVDRLMRAVLAEEARRGRLPGVSEDDARQGTAGMVALAMGKMGAGELNYSCDIDLICLYDETRHDRADQDDIRAGLVRATRRLTALVSDRSADGYIFRTDLRLRPDASVTPVCLSMGAAEQYYEAQGRTWERAAYIKARAAAGDIAAGERFLNVLTPFVWRRHLDFAAIADAHDMRLRIRSHKGLHGGAGLVLEGCNLKLAPGGIREIEFFAQTRQLIAGGRDPALRDRTTVGALGALSEAGWVDRADADELTAHYRAHREVEHRLQMVQDAQTHALPVTPEGFDRIARMTGEGDTGAFRLRLAERLRRVAALTEGFFNPGGTVRPVADPLPSDVQAVIDGWRAYPALRSERAVEIFKRLQPDILSRLSRASNPDEALRQFDAFLSRLPAGVQLFSLFQANPQLIDLIVDICATAPALADYLGRNAGVFDAVIGGSFFVPWPGVGTLVRSLGDALAGVPDYEAKLNQARVWLKEWHFRIGVHHLRGLIGADAAGAQYSDLAEACIAGLWPVVTAEFARKHGPLPGRGAAVVAMGSLGAGRLNAGSDLDLIVICDPQDTDQSEGQKPLPVRVYYARLTQALVTALTAPMGEGRLYEVDMRLRPSGRQGPVATTLAAFRDYQMNEAWTWEHLALTRARVVAGGGDLAASVEAVRCAVLAAKAGRAAILTDTADMRVRIFASKATDGAFGAKVGPGRLQDIELVAQSAALTCGSPARTVSAQIAAGQSGGFFTADEAGALTEGYAFFWTLQAASRLLSDQPPDPGGLGAGGRGFLLRETAMPDLDALMSRLALLADRAAGIVTARLGAPSAPGPDGG